MHNTGKCLQKRDSTLMMSGLQKTVLKVYLGMLNILDEKKLESLGNYLRIQESRPL